MPTTFKVIGDHGAILLNDGESADWGRFALSPGRGWNHTDAFLPTAVHALSRDITITFPTATNGIGWIGESSIAVRASGNDTMTMAPTSAVCRYDLVCVKVTLDPVTYVGAAQYWTIMGPDGNTDPAAVDALLPAPTTWVKYYELFKIKVQSVAPYVTVAARYPMLKGSPLVIPNRFTTSTKAIPVGSLVMAKDTGTMTMRVGEGNNNTDYTPMSAVHAMTGTRTGVVVPTNPETAMLTWTPSDGEQLLPPQPEKLNIIPLKFGITTVNTTTASYSLSPDKSKLYACAFDSTISKVRIARMESYGWNVISSWTCPFSNTGMVRSFQVSADQTMAFVWLSDATGVANMANLCYFVTLATGAVTVCTFAGSTITSNVRAVSDGKTFAYVWGSTGTGASADFYYVTGTGASTAKAAKENAVNTDAFMVGTYLVMKPSTGTASYALYNPTSNAWTAVTPNGSTTQFVQGAQIPSVDGSKLLIINTTTGFVHAIAAADLATGLATNVNIYPEALRKFSSHVLWSKASQVAPFAAWFANICVNFHANGSVSVADLVNSPEITAVATGTGLVESTKPDDARIRLTSDGVTDSGWSQYRKVFKAGDTVRVFAWPNRSGLIAPDVFIIGPLAL